MEEEAGRGCWFSKRDGKCEVGALLRVMNEPLPSYKFNGWMQRTLICSI
jgi:hypothetical protein